MNDFQCVRCGGSDRLSAPPTPGPTGIRVYESICSTCWQAWQAHQMALINHYALNLRDPQAKKFLTEQMEQFLFAPASQPDA